MDKNGKADLGGIGPKEKHLTAKSKGFSPLSISNMLVLINANLAAQTI